MNRLLNQWLGKTVVLITGSMLLASQVITKAGDAIIIGNEKSKIEPVQDSALNKEESKELQIGNQGGGLYIKVPIFSLPAPRDLKKEKREKLKRIEEANWMTLKEGELQDEQDLKDDNLGIGDKDDSLLGNDSINIMFRGILDKNKQGSGQAKQARPSGMNNTRHLQASEEDEDLSRFVGASLQSTSKGEAATTASASSSVRQTEFRKFLETPAAGSYNSGKPELLSDSTYKSHGFLGLSREQQAMQEEFRTFMNGSPASSEGALGWNRPAAPASRTMDFLPRNAPNSAVTPNDASVRGWNGQVSGFGSLPPANLNPAPRQSLPLSGFEPIRPKGMNSLGGH